MTGARDAAGALVLAGLLLAAGLMVTRPLAREWRDALPVNQPGVSVTQSVLPHAPGDTLQLYYFLWLFRDSLLGPTPLLQDPYQFRLDGPRPNLPQTFLPLSLPYLALSPLGPLAAYNALVFLSFPLTGLAAWLLVRRYTDDPWAAAAAGIALALAPGRVATLVGGHAAGFALGLVPLCVWGADRALLDERGRYAGAVVGGTAFLALAMLEPHYAFVTAGLLALYAPLRWLTAGPARPRAFGAPLLFAALVAAGAVWLWLLRQAFLVGSIAEGGRPLQEVRLFSPGPDLLREPGTYGGLAVLALALAGLAARSPGAGRAVRAFYGLALVGGLALSVGPTLPGLPVYELLHRVVPLFRFIRNPVKFQVLAMLAGAVLAAFGVAAVRGWLAPRARGWAGLALALLVLVSAAPRDGIVLSRVPDGPVEAALRSRAQRVAYLPIWPGDSAWSSVYLYQATLTRIPMLNGYSPLVPRRYVAEVYRPLQPVNLGDFTPEAHGLLRRLGVTHLVLHRAVIPPQVTPFPSAFTRARLLDSGGLVLEEAADPLVLLRLTDATPAVSSRTSPVGVFYEAETLLRETGTTRQDPGASGRRVAAAAAGDPAGFLAFGPYRYFPSGTYRATFRTRGRGLTLDVASDRGRRILARTDAPDGPGWRLTTLTFRLAEAGPLEMRVGWAGPAEAAVDWVLVAFADRPQPEWAFEAEDLPHLLGERPDAEASGGWAGYADPEASARANLLTGPARLFPAGRYRLSLRARATGAARGPVLRVSVTEPAGVTVASRPVEASELAPGAYREVGLDFDLREDAVLEFPVLYLGQTGVLLDRVTVTPR